MDPNEEPEEKNKAKAKVVMMRKTTKPVSVFMSESSLWWHREKVRGHLNQVQIWHESAATPRLSWHETFYRARLFDCGRRGRVAPHLEVAGRLAVEPLHWHARPRQLFAEILHA